MPRAKGIQIYLKPGIEEDDILLNLWEVCKTKARPQEIFRRILQKGLLQMIAQNEISDSILEEVGYQRHERESEDIEIIEKVVPKSPSPPKKIKEVTNIEKNKQEPLYTIIEQQPKKHVEKTSVDQKEKPKIGRDLM